MKKNILWVVADHQALANRDVDPGVFPLQSRLRATGVEFERAYTVLPICSPARASMLTGLYPHTHGLTENDGRFGGRAELDGSDHMIQHDFAAAGYRCGWFGKWHLSQDGDATDFGFEGYSLPGYGYPYSTDAYRAYLSRFHDGPLFAEIEAPGEARLPVGHHIDMTAANEWYEYEAGSSILHGPEEVHEAYFIADLAKTWIDSLEDDTPFFLRVDAWGPHPPYTIPSGFQSDLGEVPLTGNLSHDLGNRPQHHVDYRDEWLDALPEEGRDWALLSRRAIEHCIVVERALMTLVDHLEATGKLQDTIIVFCADHGDAVASNGGVMNKGSLMVEETLRIPMLFSGPGIAPGHHSDALTCSMDIAPTLADLTGIPLRNTLQGVSIASDLATPDGPATRARLMSQHYGLHTLILQRCLHMEGWKYIIQADGFEELYHLDQDPCELSNRAQDPDAADRRATMRRNLLAEMDAQKDNDPRLTQIRETLSQV